MKYWNYQNQCIINTVSKIDKDMKNNDVINTIIDIYYQHKERYEYRRIILELHNRGFKINHKKVKRLIHQWKTFSNDETRNVL